MTTIKLKLLDECIEFVSSPPVYSGDVETIQTQFEFDSFWDGFVKTAVFYNNITRPYQKVLKDDICTIPHEVMTTEGRIYIGVFGVNGNKVKTSEVAFYDIGQGVITGSGIVDPSEDMWQQILDELQTMRKLAEDLTTQQNDFETKITQEHAQHVTDVNNLVDQRLSSVYRPCGSVATVNDLPTNAKVGDVYDVLESGVNHVWTGDKWDSLAGNIDLTNYYTKAQTDSEIDTAKSEVIDQMKSTVKAYTLLASTWVDNRYTIKDPLITTTSNQKIMLAMDMTDDQLNAYGSAMLTDGGQSNGQMTIIAKGEVPTIDVPIRIMYSYTLLDTPRASDKVTLSDRNDTGDSIAFGVDGNGNYGYIEQGTQTVKPFGTKYELDKEVMTGDVWIDGKAIFCQTVKLYAPNRGEVFGSVINCNELINFKALLKITTSLGTFYRECIYGAEVTVVFDENNKFKLENNSDNNVESTIIAFYTKSGV